MTNYHLQITRKQTIRRAKQINAKLEKLQDEIRLLVSKIEDTQLDILPHINQLKNTLWDLASFDLEDSIINACDYED